MEISGSIHSLIDLGTVTSQARAERAMSVSVVKKGLDTQAAAALRLIATVQQVAPPSPVGGSSGSQVDVTI